MRTASRVRTALSAYVLALLQNAAITTLLFVAGFAMAGVSNWFLTGLVCGILNLIPWLGSILSLGLALLVAWAGSGGHDWTPLAFAAAVWLLVQVIDGFVLSPRAAG